MKENVVKGARKCEVDSTGDYNNIKNSFAQLMQLHIMLEDTVVSLLFLESPGMLTRALKHHLTYVHNFSPSFSE